MLKQLLLLALLAPFSFASFADEQSKTTETQPAQRIVALAPHIVEMLYAIGAGSQIIGTVEHADYPEAAKNIPRLGGYHGVQLEKVLALQPDLVIVWTSGNQDSDIQKLKQLGLPIAYSAPKQIEDVAAELRELGRLTGHVEQAEQQALTFEHKLAKLRQQYSGLTPLNAFYQVWPEPMMTVNGSTWIHQLMGICSANNVFADNPVAYPKIGMENLLVAAPEVIIIADQHGSQQPEVNWQPWQQIPAVAKQQIIHVQADLLHRFSPRLLLGLTDMCNQLSAFR